MQTNHFSKDMPNAESLDWNDDYLKEKQQITIIIYPFWIQIVVYSMMNIEHSND